MSALSIVNAKKNYGALQALKGINLEIKKGEFFGLLGPNGAGKTTLISSIVGLCHLSEGSISVYGYDVRKDFLNAHKLVGYSPQEINLDRFFSIKKILIFQAGFFGASRPERQEIAERLLSQFRLEDKADVPYYRLSGGMQKRLLVAKAMVGNPQVLILDEPTAGVDVEQRHELWNYLRGLNRDGTTIILTTHYIDEAEELCERIGIMHLGETREMGSPVELIQRYCKTRVLLKTSVEVPPERFNNLDFKLEVKGRQITAWGSQVATILEILQKIFATCPNCRIEDLHIERGSLEDVFLKVTGSKMSE